MKYSPVFRACVDTCLPHCLATFLTGIDSKVTLTVLRCREATDQIRVAKRSAVHGCREIGNYILSEKLSMPQFQYRERKQQCFDGNISEIPSRQGFAIE
jgi:hypothetical protein